MFIIYILGADPEKIEQTVPMGKIKELMGTSLQIRAFIIKLLSLLDF